MTGTQRAKTTFQSNSPAQRTNTVHMNSCWSSRNSNRGV